MNRAERRKVIKEFEKIGLTHEQAKRMLEIHEAPDLAGSLKEDDRVKLNLKSIQGHPDYSRMDSRYRKFVEEHKDDIFTVQYDPKNPDDRNVVCLLEDDSDVKWRFWNGNLEKVGE